MICATLSNTCYFLALKTEPCSRNTQIKLHFVKAIRSLFGSHSISKSRNKTLLHGFKYTAVGLPLSSALSGSVAAVTARHLLGADIGISLTLGWIGWNSEVLELIKQLFSSPFYVTHLTVCFPPTPFTHPITPCVYMHSIKADMSPETRSLTWRERTGES